MKNLKIFESETVHFLKELGHSSVDIATLQRKALKQYVLDRLVLIHSRIEHDQFDSAKGLLEVSPAGDDMGCHNHYIRFDFPEHDNMDINEVIDLMIELKHIIDGPQPQNDPHDDDLPF
jgi:hypothetical protein